jgi:hypothetical protein
LYRKKIAGLFYPAVLFDLSRASAGFCDFSLSLYELQRSARMIQLCNSLLQLHNESFSGGQLRAHLCELLRCQILFQSLFQLRKFSGC